MNIKIIFLVLTVLVVGNVAIHSHTISNRIEKQLDLLKANIKYLNKMDSDQQGAFILFVKYLEVLKKINSKQLTQIEMLDELLPIHDQLIDSFTSQSKRSERMRKLLLNFIQSIWKSSSWISTTFSFFFFCHLAVIKLSFNHFCLIILFISVSYSLSLFIQRFNKNNSLSFIFLFFVDSTIKKTKCCG